LMVFFRNDGLILCCVSIMVSLNKHYWNAYLYNAVFHWDVIGPRAMWPHRYVAGWAKVL